MYEELIKNKKYGQCSICGKYGKFSYDHVPPKNCGNNNKVYYDHFIPDRFNPERPTISHDHSQNGVKFYFICESCNNLLGSKYDIDLMLFREKLLSDSLSPKIPNLNHVIKSIIGHLLAATPFNSIKINKDLRELFASDDTSILNNYSLFCFFYPYKDHIVILRNYMIVNLIEKSDKMLKGLLSSLYFYPFAFILSEKQEFCKGVDLIKSASIKSDIIQFSINDWKLNGEILTPNWPCDVHDNTNGTQCLITIESEAKHSIVTRTIPEKR